MSIRRTTIVCALLILALSASPALAGQSPAAARAQARYYASYGAPEPLHAPQAPAAPSDDSPLIVVAIVAAAALGVGAAVQFRRVRGRHTAGAVS